MTRPISSFITNNTGQQTVHTVIISRNAYAWQFGGAEQFTFNLARELKNQGFRPVVVTRVPELLAKCREQKIATFKNIWLKNAVRRRWMVLYYPLLPLLLTQYLYLLIRFKASLLIAGSRDDQIFGTLAAGVLKKPSIWIDHADLKGIFAYNFGIMHKTYPKMIARADRLIAVSNFEREQVLTLTQTIDPAKFIVINNGAIKGSPDRKVERPDGKVILYIGRIEKEKGMFELLEAAELLLKDHPDYFFWLVGKGRDEATIREGIRKHHLEANIRLLGHQENVWDYLAVADLFVYPTHHDASPLAPAEALLAGLPVVATRVGGIPEVVNESCGILVNPGSAVEIAAAVTSILTDIGRYGSLRQGAIERGQQFDFTSIVRERYVPLINAVIAERQS